MSQKIYLTHESLQCTLQAFFSEIKGKSAIFYDFFWNLYTTGLRYSELKRFDLWELSDGGVITINTLKGGAQRTNMQQYLTPFCVSSFMAGTSCYSRLSSSTLCYWLETFLPMRFIFHDTKSIKTHIFRHALAKKMNSEGYTDTQIALFFGEKDLNNMRNYINSDLYYWD